MALEGLGVRVGSGDLWGQDSTDLEDMEGILKLKSFPTNSCNCLQGAKRSRHSHKDRGPCSSETHLHLGA